MSTTHRQVNRNEDCNEDCLCSSPSALSYSSSLTYLPSSSLSVAIGRPFRFLLDHDGYEQSDFTLES